MSDTLKDLSKSYEQFKKKAENILATTMAPLSREDWKKLTDEEITDMIKVVTRLPCRLDEVSDQLYNEQVAMMRAAFERKRLYSDPEKAARVIAFVKAKLEMHFLKGSMTPGTPLGMVISDDLGASVMQGTLNTRHKAGSRQNAAGGLRVQREVLAIRPRSAPVVTIAFTQRETFESITTKWRALLVEVKVERLTYNVANDFRIIDRRKGDPSWYDSYNRIVNDIRIPASNYALELRVRTDVMYSHQLTLSDITEAINNSDEANKDSNYVAIYSPLSLEGGPVIHIIPSVPSVPAEVPLGGESHEGVQPVLEVDPAALMIGNSLPKLRNIHISGIPGVKNILPLGKKVTDLIRDEINKGEYTVVRLHERLIQVYGMGSDDVTDLCNVSGVATIPLGEARKVKDLLPLIKAGPVVICRTPKFDLSELIINKTKSQSYLPRADIIAPDPSTKDKKVWTIRITDPASDAVLRYEKILGSMKLKYTIVRGSGGAKDQKEAVITVEPPGKPPKVIDIISWKRLQDLAHEAEYEQAQREKRARLGAEALVSVIRPPNDISRANVYYIAELQGATLAQLIDIQGIDISRSYSNYAVEIANFLGIEAARAFLGQEIVQVWRDSDSNLQPTTVQTTIDYMTYRGALVPFSTHGIVSQPIGFMSKSTVTTAMKYIQGAGADGEVDPMTSAPGNIMVAKMIPMGTGSVTAISLTPFLPPAEEEEDNPFAPEDLIDNVYEDVLDEPYLREEALAEGEVPEEFY